MPSEVMAAQRELRLRSSARMRIQSSVEALFATTLSAGAVANGNTALGGSVGLIAAALAWRASTHLLGAPITVTADEIRVRTTFSRRTVRLSGVAAFRFSWYSSRYESGNRLSLTMFAGDVTRNMPGLLEREAPEKVAAFFAQCALDIPINPKLPWRDRTGGWHTASDGYDPVESLRSVHQAAVGEWTITIRPSVDGFAIERKSALDGRVASRQTAATRPEAVTVAEAEVKRARADGVAR